jgi:putative flavoprotein involved in K+ transport
MGGAASRVLVPFLFRVVFHRVLTVKTAIGRKARPSLISRGGPLIRVKPKDLAAAGVERVGRLAGVRDGLPLLDDGRVLDVANIVWCTGFDCGLSWIDLPILDARGEPRHDCGVALGEPGLYFVGQHFQYAMSSTMIHGVARDAERIAREIQVRLQAGAAADTRVRAELRRAATT